MRCTERETRRAARVQAAFDEEKGSGCCVHATEAEFDRKRGGSAFLDTLAQLAHGSLSHSIVGRLDGAGRDGAAHPLGELPEADADPRASLRKRARAKFATVPLATSLAEIAKARRPPDPLGERRAPGSRAPLGELEQAYRNTVYCCGELEQKGALIRGQWCGNRWCLACSRVRTARAWNRYAPHIGEWSDRYFISLTIPNVSGEALPLSLRAMRKRLQRVRIAMARTDGIRLKALLKVECTFNAERCDYHPHYHLVAEGAASAEALRRRWLVETPGARAVAQDVRPCSAEGLRELFKYFTKLTTGGKAIDPNALDEIFRAMRGLRVFQPIGFRAPVTKDGDDETGRIAVNCGTRAPRPELATALWVWHQQSADWVNDPSGEALTGYVPNAKFRAFVDSLAAH